MYYSTLIPNGITLLRLPVIGLLAWGCVQLISGVGDTVLGIDLTITPLFAAILFAIGLASHCFDGIVTKWLGYETPLEGLWHELDTVAFSIGLQIPAMAYLVVTLGDGALQELLWGFGVVAYFVCAALIEGLYVEPRKQRDQPYVPIVLVGSAFVWMALAVLLADTAGWPALIAPMYVLSLGTTSFFLHREVWERWYVEFSRKRLSRIPG